MEALRTEELQKQIETIKAEKVRISNMQYEIDSASSDLAGRLFELEKELNSHVSQLTKPSFTEIKIPTQYKRSINVQGYLSVQDFNRFVDVVNHYRTSHNIGMTMSTLFRLVMRHFLDHRDSVDIIPYWKNDAVVISKHSGQKPKGKASAKRK